MRRQSGGRRAETAHVFAAGVQQSMVSRCGADKQTMQVLTVDEVTTSFHESVKKLERFLLGLQWVDGL